MPSLINNNRTESGEKDQGLSKAKRNSRQENSDIREEKHQVVQEILQKRRKNAFGNLFIGIVLLFAAIVGLMLLLNLISGGFLGLHFD